MPSTRRMKVTGLIALLTVCIIFYVTNGARSTQNSDFYTRTVAAIKDRKTAEEHQHALVEESERLERVERLHAEHDIAMSAQAADAGDSVKDQVAGPPVGDKSVAGRKKMKDDKLSGEKPLRKDSHDGVAKVGNIAEQPTNVLDDGDATHTEEDHKIETTLNEILKRGPIIIFSKTMCPFSRKAKQILLEVYDITPPPFVVELDIHELGPGLQAQLKKITGRGTVPNVLINGKSIGGGDDIEALHKSDTLIDTVQSMGGKRIMKVVKSKA